MKLSLNRYRYVSQIPTRVCANYVPLCVCVLAHVRMCVYIRCVYIRTCEFKYSIEYVKIYRSSGTFDTHSSLMIFEFGRLIKGLPQILLQCPVEILLAVWQLKKNSTNCQIKITNLSLTWYIFYIYTTHMHFKSLRIFICNIYIYTIYIAIISLVLWTM